MFNSKKIFRIFMILMVSLCLGFVACSDDSSDDDPAPVAAGAGGISGTIDFWGAYDGTDYTTPTDCTAGALVLAIAIDSTEYTDPTDVDSLMPAMMAAMTGTNSGQQNLAAAVDTADYTIEGLADGTYWVMVVVYNGGAPGIPAGTDFAGQHGDLTAVAPAIPFTEVTVAGAEVTGIDVNTLPYSVIEAMAAAAK